VTALRAGCHIFIEKPLAMTVEASERIVAVANEMNKKVVVGYILRHHPSWVKFIDMSKQLGSPLVMRMNLNQQSQGRMWDVHKNLMNAIPPIVDCGVHYVDVMCQMTQSKPIRVSAMGTRLSDELSEGSMNYGQLQVTFEDGSVGWYEAGWGPMASTQAFFVKDVWGPKGCVSIVADKASEDKNSDHVDAHTKTERLRFHDSKIDANNKFINEDQFIDTEDEPDHNELCKREQEYFCSAIQEDVDLSSHLNDAVNSLKIVLAADESIKSGQTVYF
jgi:predicted dehydrogenase